MIELTLLIITIIISIFFAILILSRDYKNKTNQYFSLLILFITIWVLSHFFQNEPFFREHAALLFKIDFASAPFLVFFFYLFCVNFPYVKVATLRRKKIIYLPVLFLSILSFTPLVLKDIGFYDSVIDASPGPFFILYFLGILLYTEEGLRSLIIRYRRSKDIEKSQIRYVLIGLSIASLVVFTVNLILGVLFILPPFIARSSILAAFLIFYVCTTYAVTKHHLFGIRVILTEVLVGAIALTLLVQVLTIEGFGWKIFGSITLVLFGILGYLLIKTTLQEIQRRKEIEILSDKLKVSNIRLEAAFEALKKLDKVKTEFLSIASHQLRTPLTAIKGYLSMLQEGLFGRFKKEVTNILDKMYISSERLIELINSLLNMSRIEMGRMEFKFEKAQIEEIAESVTEELLIQARRKNLSLSFKKPKKLLPKIKIDKEKIRQVILNLVDNAVKYTEKGRVTVKLRSITSKIQVVIKDTGIGMTRGELESLFSMYVRGKRRGIFPEGSGLGLYVARKMVEAHNGKVWAESKGKGRGSTFYIELPIK